MRASGNAVVANNRLADMMETDLGMGFPLW
jgi:hypothetical protein